MKTLAIGEFKARFSSVLADIKAGHPVAVAYGKSRRRLAILMPYGQYHKSSGRTLGILETRGSCKLKKEFSMSDEDLVNS